ncbi:LuxR C-terminal-related transcriptional regulator [Streptomyces fagopyri]|uniref:LuxR C-terminal-related transcriptional regulator n=1 Tax=Streptomyces fagopyri TaxID=2662397 RepID=UPI003F4CDE39
MVVSAVAALDENGTGPAPAHVDPLGDPFLRTRFALPTRPGTFLRRERLTEHLDQALLTPLTMVNGAAGAGKTLLVADWAAGLGRPVTWLTTDAAGQGPGMFWAYLLQALYASGVPVPHEIRRPADAHGVDRELPARLAAGLSGRDHPAIVVLDEYDRVTAPEIAEQLEFVLHHAGPGLRLVLVTRTEPLLPLHRYRAAGDLTEIRDAELAFTPDEASALLATHGLHLPAPGVRALVDRTRGWAAGLRLCALAARETPDPETYLKEFEAGQSTVADYLLAEVLKRRTAETQDLLLRVSVLERFCPELANALTERTDAEPILAGLHRENAFVESLGHSWYRLHPLFGEILRAHLRVRSPGLEPELHRRAARWLRRSGSLPETLAHGAAAGDWEFTAGALVDDLAIGQLFTGLRSEDLTELFSGMDPEATSPATNLVRAARDLSRHDLDRGLAHLRNARQGLAREAPAQEGPAGNGEPGLGPARLSCALLEALAARLAGSPDDAEAAASAAEELRKTVPARLLELHPELSTLLLTHLGSALLWAGRFEDARAALSTVAGSCGEEATGLPREDALAHLALLDYLDGWLDRAESAALAATTGTEHLGPHRSAGSGLARLVLAAVAVDRDELDRAQALLDETADAGRTSRDPVTAAGRSLAAAGLLLARGRTGAALTAASAAIPAAVASPWANGHAALVAAAVHLAEGRTERAAEALRRVPDDQTACAVRAARVHLAAGHRGEAIGMLDRLHLNGRCGPALTVRATLVRAQAAEEAGDPVTARGLVARALVEARRERLRRPFLDAGPWIRRPLGEAPLRALAAGWLQAGPARGQGGDPGRLPSLSPVLVVEELSGRELDVLRRLAEMMSTEEIAADLYVSVNTVKTHLKSVYRKLAVNRRNEAVRRARELRLL